MRLLAVMYLTYSVYLFRHSNIKLTTAPSKGIEPFQRDLESLSPPWHDSIESGDKGIFTAKLEILTAFETYKERDEDLLDIIMLPVGTPSGASCHLVTNKTEPLVCVFLHSNQGCSCYLLHHSSFLPSVYPRFLFVKGGPYISRTSSTY